MVVRVDRNLQLVLSKAIRICDTRYLVWHDTSAMEIFPSVHVAVGAIGPRLIDWGRRMWAIQSF